MKQFRITSEPTAIDTAIDEAARQLATKDADSPEFAVIVDQITRLTKLKEKPSQSRVSPDALLAVFGNLAGIILVINHERVNIITTKAFGLVMKSKQI